MDREMTDLIRKSRMLARVLRHEPQLIGIELDPGGWALESDLLNGFRGVSVPFTRRELAEIIETDKKSRFTRQGIKVRAAQGHSIPVDLGLTPVRPPRVLLHGTATDSLNGIFARGLEKRRRNYVHLNVDVETALQVGRRHGKAVVLRIDSEKMSDVGFEFFRAENGVWLTEEVPATYLSVYSYDDAVG